jgi:acetyl esterase
MMAVVALLAKERRGPGIKAQLLFYPVTDASKSTTSYETFAEGPWLTKKAMAWFWDQYLPDAPKRADIHVSPINATTEELKELPPTLLLVDENDVLRDEGKAYGRKLAAAGVPVISVRYNGTIHDFMLLIIVTANFLADVGYCYDVLGPEVVQRRRQEGQMADVFISYSTKDRATASDLAKKG